LLTTNDRVTVAGNEIYYPTSTFPIAGIEVDGGNNITIRSNHVRVVGKNRTGIDFLSVSSFTITDNTIMGSGLAGASQLTAGIKVTNSTFGLIASNVILGDTMSGILLGNESKTAVLGNSVNLAANCILETTNGSDYNIISGNVLNNCGIGLSYVGPHDAATNNTGFNHGTIQSLAMMTESQIAASSSLNQEFVLGFAIVIAGGLCVALIAKFKHRRPKKTAPQRRGASRHGAKKNAELI